MTVIVEDRNDINLANFERVALRGEDVRFGPRALSVMGKAHADFQEYVAGHRDRFIYGVTSGGGPDATRHTAPEEQARRRQEGQNPHGLAFGDGSLPEYTVRGAVFATLSMFVEGNTATHPERAQKIAAMLGGPMPAVPDQGITVPGEIIASTHLYGGVPRSADEGHSAGSLNGCQHTNAMAAVSAIFSRRRLELAASVFALSVEAFNAPLEAYDPALKALWGDRYEGEALDKLGEMLAGAPATKRRPYQAPVSWRILPRVLGQAHRCAAWLEDVADVSLRSIASNPAFVPPFGRRPGKAFSSAGYHNAIAPPAMDGMAAAWTDLMTLAHRHVAKLHKPDVSLLPDRLRRVGNPYSTHRLDYVGLGYVEEARLLAQPTLLTPAEAGASEQDDIAAAGALAYVKLTRVSRLFDMMMAVLAGVSSHALAITDRAPPPRLGAFTAAVRAIFPPVQSARPIGEELAQLADMFSASIVDGKPMGTADR